MTSYGHIVEARGGDLTVKLVTEESDQALPERDAVTKYLAETSRRGGIKGRKACASALPPEHKAKHDQKAAQARWNCGK